MNFFKDTFQNYPSLVLLGWALIFCAFSLGSPLLFCLVAPWLLLAILKLREYLLKIQLGIGFIICSSGAIYHSTPSIIPTISYPVTAEVHKIQDRPDSRILDIQIENQLFRTKLMGSCLLWPHDEITFTQTPQFPQKPRNPGMFDAKTWFISQNYSGSFNLACEEIQIRSHNEFSLKRFFYEQQTKLREHISQQFPTQSGALLLAMLIGNDDFLDQDLSQSFKLTGLTHILAISGFHIALIALILQICFGIFTHRKWLHFVLTFLFLMYYTPLTGSPPSVERAVLFYILYTGSGLLHKRKSALNTLFLTATILLLWNPNQILDLGFQLSFLATFGLIYPSTNKAPQDISIPLNTWQTINVKLVDALKSTLWATIMTAPILITQFYSISLASFIGNLFAVPLSTAFMIAGALGLMIPPSVATPFIVFSVFCYDLLEISMKWLSEIPGLKLQLNFINPLQELSIWGLFILWPLRRKLSARLVAYLMILTLVLPPLWQSYHDLKTPKCHFWTLDVGQGDALLIQSPQNHHILIDDGGQNFYTGKDQVAYSILPFLKSQGIEKLDALILTHADLDHIGGTLSLIEQIPIHQIFINPQDLSNPKEDWQKILHKAQTWNIPIRSLSQGQYFQEEHFFLRVLHPIIPSYPESNWASVVILLQFGQNTALLTGDLEEAGERDFLQSNPNLKAQVLKVGHHGSKNGTSEEFLNQIQPQIALISAGPKNRYHHPHPDLIKRLNQSDIKIYQTKDSGAIHLMSDSENWYYIP